MRKPIVAGNWKMNKSVSEAIELANGIKMDHAECFEVEVVLCPPCTALKAVSDVVAGTAIKLGAQNMHFEDEGAYTGEISPTMLRDVYCHYVILGHSERRAYFGETNEIVNKKVLKALSVGLQPIMCCGETLEQREAEEAKTIIEAQIREGLAEVGDKISNVVVAYEPVWAIGTGLTATPEQAQEMHAFIRGILADMFGKDAANGIRIQYGGSMKPANARDLLDQPDIDGGLIGGAALDAGPFGDIVRAAYK